jgi:3-oxoacyl-[acyl-carrier protein] reductase
MDLGITGKYALITGGTHGIGRAIALDLAVEGCNVAVFSRSKDKVLAMSKELERYNISYIAEIADVMVQNDVRKITNIIDERWGRIDILVNNVGGGGRWGKDVVEETDYSVWEDVYNKNSGAAIKFTMWAIKHMRKNKWGRVITISSIYGKEAGGRPWFSMAKSAEISLMKSLSTIKYLVRDGITFNTVAPGNIYIEGTGHEEEKKRNESLFLAKLDNLVMGRMGTVEEISFWIKCICSVYGSFLNGACIVADGGETKSF